MSGMVGTTARAGSKAGSGVQRALLRDARVWICTAILAVIGLAAILAPYIAPHPYEAINAAVRLQSHAEGYPLGADHFGRDILSRLIWGARMTLIVSLGSVAVATIGGLLLGMIAAFYGGAIEAVIMRIIDAILCFPAILLAIFVVAFVGPELHNIILTIGILYIPRIARVAHAVTLVEKTNEYVDAARAMGAFPSRILWKAILPNIMAPIIVQMSLALGTAVLLESSLSFLGMGPPPPMPSWGRMVGQASAYMHLSPHAVIWPALSISVSILALNVLGDALRDILDPKRAK